MRYVIRPANAYASTISGCGNGCTDSVNFSGQCNYKGIDSTSCQKAKDIYNKKIPAGTIHAPTPPPPAVIKPLPSRFPSTVNLSTGGGDKVKKLNAKVSGGVSGTPGQGGSVGTSVSQQKGNDIPSSSSSSSSSDNTPPPPSSNNDSCPSDCSGAFDLQCQFNKIVCPLANQFNIPQQYMLPGAIGIIILITMLFIIRR